MGFSDVLKKVIENSNLSYREISERCKEAGKSIDPSYISKLVNNKISPPSDEITNVLAEVCGADKNILIIESYLEKAPKEIIEFICSIKNTSLENLLPGIAYGIPSDQIELIKQSLYEEPLSKFIIDALNEYNNKETKDIMNFEPLIEAKDNSLNPIIPKGSKVTFESKEQYTNGDIVVINIDNETIIRRYYNKGELYIFCPVNLEYEPLICRLGEFEILGKVTKVVASY